MKHIGSHPMNMRLVHGALALLIAAAGTQTVGAYTCDTTRVTSETFQGMGDAVYLADCRIGTDESSPFIVASGNRAFLTAEQQIRLEPGFHAERGSYFHAKLRPCIRNPEANTGAASWGNYDEDPPGVEWIKVVAEAFVEKFDTGGLTVKLKYQDELAQYGVDIPDFYCDAERMSSGPASPRCVGGDDDLILLQLGTAKIHPQLVLRGIDDGVFFFHIGHGGGGVLGPFVRNGDASTSVSGSSTQITWPHFRLGNCSSDGSSKGELRYLWLCSCRSFGHGPPIDDSTESRVEYDRPSRFDADAGDHADVFSRLGPVLSPNMRMACGASTSAHCGNPDHVATYLKEAYFTEGLSVAESWGVAHTQDHWKRGRHPLTDINGDPILDADGNQLTRVIYQTPLCIARGNLDPNDLRSPITDDLRFSAKANPYDEALHVVYWETYASVVEMGGGFEIAATPISFAGRAAAAPDPYRPVVFSAQPQATAKKRAVNEEKMRRLPVLLTAPSTPVWMAGGGKRSADEQFLSSSQWAESFSIEGDRLISKEMTRDGRPKVRVDPRAGAVSLAGNRALVNAAADSRILPLKSYAEIARRFIEGQGWSESDMGAAVAVKAELQVVPVHATAGARLGPRKVMRIQKDVSFYIGRLIPLEGVAAKVLGSDNQVVVQMNNDGSIIRASKRWMRITGKVKGVPVKSFEDAYEEARLQLGNPLLYDLVDWDWGYRSITHDDGQEMMVLHYTFTFEPLPKVVARTDSPLVVEIRAHVLEDGPVPEQGARGH